MKLEIRDLDRYPKPGDPVDVRESEQLAVTAEDGTVFTIRDQIDGPGLTITARGGFSMTVDYRNSGLTLGKPDAKPPYGMKCYDCGSDDVHRALDGDPEAELRECRFLCRNCGTYWR